MIFFFLFFFLYFIFTNKYAQTHTGGVFVTWRQKDRDPSQVGVLGKTTFNDTQDEKEAQTQHRIADYNRNGARNWRRINTTAANRETNETKVEPAASGQQPVNVDDGNAKIKMDGQEGCQKGPKKQFENQPFFSPSHINCF